MPRYKPYNYSQTVMIPVCLTDQLVPGTFEFAIHKLVDERVDVSCFDEKFNNDETGRPAYDPKVILKVVLLAYSRGIIPSRKIERACHENVIFMALGCTLAPDHTTISRFISTMHDEILSIFRDILLVCEELHLLGGTSFSLDGCKLPSNASKRWSGTFDDLKRKKEKIEKKVERLLESHQQLDKEDIATIDNDTKKRYQEQIKNLQQKADRIAQWLNNNEPKIGKDNKEVKSNITDNDSAKMVTSHGTIQGYNAQALVDDKHQVIVHPKASGKGQDYDHVITVIDGAKENVAAIGLGDDYFEGKKLSADSNYHSEGNLEKCKEEKIDAYIPDVNFRKRDPRFATQGRYKPPKPKKKYKIDDFQYNEEKDYYICPNQKQLKLYVRKQQIGQNKFRRYRTEEDVCCGCKLRKKCLQYKNGKRKYLSINLGKDPENLSRQMIEKIDSVEGRKIYERRFAVIEPVFANIRNQKRLDRFTLRGNMKVNIQWSLYCIVHNIEKILNYGFVYA